jgi:hypothetical protein
MEWYWRIIGLRSAEVLDLLDMVFYTKATIIIAEVDYSIPEFKIGRALSRDSFGNCGVVLRVKDSLS